MATLPTDALAVVVVAAFAVGVAVTTAGRERAGRVCFAAAWLLFAACWGALVPHFLFTKGSVIEGVLSLAAVLASAYVALLLYRGRTSLVTLSRGVAVMGLVYMPFQLSPALARPLVGLAVDHSAWLVWLLGYEPTMVRGSEVGQQLGIVNAFRFTVDGHGYVTEVVLACTGIGSMAIFAGLVAAVDAPARRKAKALAVVLPVIYVLNIVRVTFIALAHGNQWFRYESLAGVVAWLMGVPQGEAANRVSWFVADRVVAQSLSVLALVAIALFAVRVLPELVVVFEDVLYVATGNEYDLAGAIGSGAATDGGEREE
jgi:archaeosortase A (PGF-CTERM-specific)